MQDLQIKVSISEEDAKNTYDILIKILTGEIKNKLKHPFKSQD